MKIQPMSNVAFKGTLKVADKSSHSIVGLDSDKILSISTRKNDNDAVLLEYDYPRIVKHNGYELKEPTVFKLDYDLNTILNAYNASKNSDVTIDLSECYREN